MADPLTLRKLAFLAPDPVEGDPPEIEDVPTVTILVGPNNSGKSKALQEIAAWCAGVNESRVIWKEISVHPPTNAEIGLEMFQVFKVEPENGEHEEQDAIFCQYNRFLPINPVFRGNVTKERISAALISLRNEINSESRRHITEPFMIHIDVLSRLKIIEDCPVNNNNSSHKRNPIYKLFYNDESRKNFRNIIFDHTRKYITIDPTNISKLQLKLNDKEPASNQEEQGLHREARDYHSKGTRVIFMGDGIKALIGIFLLLVDSPHKTILLDEPEIFLHPSLSRALGLKISQIMTASRSSLVVATHSADFLMGCIESGARVAIARITYDGGNPTARTILADEIRSLMRSPLIRSTQALRGLFCKAVILSEGDRDRAFYEEINRRLMECGGGISDSIFMNGFGADFLHRIAGPLRRFGVKVALIYDLDVIVEDSQWMNIHTLVTAAESDKQQINENRTKVKQYLINSGSDNEIPNYKKKGIYSIYGSERRELEQLIERLNIDGLFFVPVGEVEGWLKGLFTRQPRKKKWLELMFDALGSDPESETYVVPSQGDVWGFLRTIARWCNSLPGQMANPSERDPRAPDATPFAGSSTLSRGAG
ncbi:MAG: AAA family ATPase [Rhizobiaceae bacterium]